MEISKLNLKSSNSFQRSLLFHLDVDSLLNAGNFSKEFVEVLKKFQDMTADIFSCHNFLENFPENVLLWEIIEEIKKIKKYSNLSEFLNKIRLLTKNKIEENYEENFVTILMCLYFFLQESIYGPSFFYIRETEKVDYHKEIEKFDGSVFAQLEKIIEEEPEAETQSTESTSTLLNDSTHRTQIKKELLDYLTIAGEFPYSNMKLLIFYVIAHDIIINSKMFDDYFQITKLWKARLYFLHNKMMKEPINELKEAIDKNNSEFDLNSILYSDDEEDNVNCNGIPKLEMIKSNSIIKGMLQLERSYSHLMYYKYKDAETAIEGAKDLFKLNISLTGALGKRTKYQEFETAILVVNSKSSTVSTKITQSEANSEEPKIVKLDEESILLEQPKLSEEENPLLKGEMSLYDQLYVNAYLNWLKRSNPDEDLLREIITAYVNKSIGKSLDWLVHSKLLLNKSLAEDKRSKTIERSLLQMQSLCDQHNDRSPAPYTRSKYIFTVDYPFIWNIKKHNAEMFMGYGAVITAFDLFNELSMYEECIQCLYVAGKTQRAVEFAESILKKKEDPGIYCVLGEILTKEEYFFKALEISKDKYTRAYRCLGKFFFSVKNNLEESLKYYEKAMEINPMFPNIWFTMGCINLRLKNWPNAGRSFSKCVALDETNSEGWANLGLAFAQVNKLKEALKCLEEAFKRNRSWKICENLMYVAIDAKDLNKIIFSINNIFMLGQHERIKPAVYFNLISIFLTNYPNIPQTQRNFFKSQIYNIFENFSVKDGITPEIWDLYALFIESAEINCMKDTITEEEKRQVYKKVCDVLLKQGRGLIIEDVWEKNEKVVERVAKVIEKLKKQLEQVNDVAYEKEVDAFVQNISHKVEKFYKIKEFEEKK